MGTAENKALVERFWRELRSPEDAARLVEELYDPKARYHGAGGEEALGSEELTEYVSQYFSAFPDMAVRTRAVIGEGDWVASSWEATGTHKGELAGIPASDRPVSIGGLTLQRFEDGKVVEEWEYPDMMAMMGQIGALDPPA